MKARGPNPPDELKKVFPCTHRIKGPCRNKYGHTIVVPVNEAVVALSSPEGATSLLPENTFCRVCNVCSMCGYHEPRLPVGTHIRFVEDLYAPADDHSPAGFYAFRNQRGIVVGHDCREGHQVRLLGAPKEAWFGAILGKEFVIYVSEDRPDSEVSAEGGGPTRDGLRFED